MATLRFKLNNGKVITGKKELSNELIFGTLGVILESKKVNGRININTEETRNEEVNSMEISEITIVF